MLTMSSAIDADSNREAAKVFTVVREFLGERRRNWVKPLPQAELAAQLEPLLGYRPAQTMLSKWERANALVPGNVLVALARLVGRKLGRAVTIEELLTQIKVSYLASAA